VTNVRGPRATWHFAGRPVTGIVPLAITPGNVGVSFDVLSYAGRLVVSLVADPLVVPDQDLLTSALASELAALTGRNAG
jgi:diacylglycerol O-acyltransferase / wax synthase